LFVPIVVKGFAFNPVFSAANASEFFTLSAHLGGEGRGEVGKKNRQALKAHCRL